MNDFSPDTSPSNNSDENRLTAEVYDDFLDALDLLYIKGNLSGRLKFLENWPVAAKYLFGDELLGFDNDGTRDTERRSVLEEEAEDRRLALLEVVETLEARSVDKSVLQTEYVEGVVKKMGRDLSLLLYAPKIVNRYIPSSDVESGQAAAEVMPAKPLGNAMPDPFEEQAARKPVMPEIDDRLDAVQPISVEQALPPAPIDPEPKPAPEMPAVPIPSDAPINKPADVPAPPPIDPLPVPPVDVPPPAEPPVQSQVPLPPQQTPQPAPAAEPRSMPAENSAEAPQEPAPSDPTVQDVSRPAVHKALDGQEPIASQKMTFMPAKREAPPKTNLEKGAVPVVGESKDKSDD